jgi:hypothetical protein
LAVRKSAAEGAAQSNFGVRLKLDLRQVKVNPRGTGSEPYPPHLLLALLIYSYATGTFGNDVYGFRGKIMVWTDGGNGKHCCWCRWFVWD